MASANRESIYIARNATAGSLIGPTATSAYYELPITGETIRPSASSTQSALIRADRTPQDLVRTGFEVGGDLNTELMYGGGGALDLLLRAVLFSADWTAPAASLTGAAVDFDESDAGYDDEPTLTLSGGPTWANFDVGDWIRVDDAGGANHGLICRIKEKATTTVAKVDHLSGTMTTESATGVTISSGERINASNSRSDLTIVKRFGDINKWEVILGALVDTMRVNVTPNAIVTASFGINAKRAVAEFDGAFSINADGEIVQSGGTAYDFPTGVNALNAAPSNAVFNSIRNAKVFLDGAKSTVLTSFGLNMANNVFGTQVVGIQGNQSVEPGSIGLTGQVEALFEDESLYVKFINDVEASMALTLMDASGQAYVLDTPAVKFTNGGTQNSGQNTNVPLQLDFGAKLDATTGRVFAITRFGALGTAPVV